MKRFSHIDFLRALAIVAVIIIHVLSDNLSNSSIFFFWNYLHFIIVAFIFCSGYVLYAFYAHILQSWGSILTWYKKRLFRLVLPFYWYLLIHYSLMLLFPKFFSGLGLLFSWRFFLESITLIGGINLNWLPLLFLQLAILFPILVLLSQKKKSIFWLYIILASCTSVAFTIWQVSYAYYRAVMWIPWSLFLVIPWYFYKKEQAAYLPLLYAKVAGGGFILFAILFALWAHLGRSLTLIDNKYPPNLFYLSYETGGSFFLLFISTWSFFQKNVLRSVYEFVSRTSYSLFFIHYIVLDVILSLNHMWKNILTIPLQVVCVVALSIGIAWILSRIQFFGKFFFLRLKS